MAVESVDDRPAREAQLEIENRAAAVARRAVTGSPQAQQPAWCVAERVVGVTASPATIFERVADLRDKFERVVREAQTHRRVAACARRIAKTQRLQAARRGHAWDLAPGPLAAMDERPGSCASASGLS